MTEQRLASLGGAVAGRLNLKRVGEPLPCDPDELADLKALRSAGVASSSPPAPIRARRRWWPPPSRSCRPGR